MLGLALCGCQQRNAALVTEPSLAELADFHEPMPRMAGWVAVDTYDPPPTIFDIPKYDQSGPTPEERKILGEPEQTPDPDALAFYKPPRGPEHGVMPYATKMPPGQWGYGGVTTARDRVASRVGVWGMGANYTGETLFDRGRTGYVGRTRELGGGSSRLTRTAEIGECFPRTGAARRPFIEY